MRLDRVLSWPGDPGLRRGPASRRRSREQVGSALSRSTRARLPPRLTPMSAAGVFDQNPAHGFGRGRKEMPAAIPGPVGLAADQSQIGFVDERGGLERLPRRLSRQPLCSEPPQLVVDERQQLASGAGLALNAVSLVTVDFNLAIVWRSCHLWSPPAASGAGPKTRYHSNGIWYDSPRGQ